MALEASIRRAGLELGFDRVGFAPIDVEAEAGAHRRFLSWLDAGRAAGLDYLRRDAERRRSVQKLLPGARSVVVVARSYNFPLAEFDAGAARVSRYALGKDYHWVMERDLKALKEKMAEFGGGRHHYHVDTGPVLERHWAEQAGVGWIGKNTLAIHPELGSYFFLGVVLTTLELAPDDPITDHCGSCRRCLDACPTQAFPEPGVLDARRCIAYWNVEHRGAFPDGVDALLGEHAFGCDICQEACPWNRPDRAARPSDDKLAPFPERFARDPLDLARALQIDSPPVLAGSGLRRAKRQGLLRNLAAVLANLGRTDARALLEELAVEPDEVVATAARQALTRLALEGDGGA